MKGHVDEGLVYHAGFPNAGEDQRGVMLSLDELVVKRRASTYFWRLETEVAELHWASGSVVVVDRALGPRDGRVVVASVDNAFCLCRFRSKGLFLLDGSPVNDVQAAIWGVVTHVLQEVA